MDGADSGRGGGPSKDSETLLRGAAVSGVGRAFATVVSFVTSVLMTRTLGAELFGVFAIANRLAGVGSTAARLGQHDAIIHFLPKYHLDDLPRARGVFLISVLLTATVSSGIAVIVFVAAVPIADRFFGDAESLSPVIRVLALGIPFTVLGALLTAVLRSLKAIRALEWVRSVTVPVGRLLFCVLLFALGYGVLGLAWAINISLLLGFVVALYSIHKSSHLLARGIDVVVETRAVFDFSFPVLLMGLVTYSYSNADIFFLGRFADTRDVGIYALALRILNVLQAPITAFHSMYVPLASELHGSGNLARLDQALKSTARWVVTSTLPLYLLTVLLARPVLSLFGPEFVDGAAVLTLLGSIAVTNAFAVLAGYAVFMSGRSWLILGNAVLLLVLSVALYWLLIPRFGSLGAGVGRAAAFAGFAGLTLGEAYLMLGIHPFHRGLFKPLAAGLASFAICYGLLASRLLPQNLLTSLSIFCLFCVLYLAALLLLGLTEEDERLIGQLKSRLGFR